MEIAPENYAITPSHIDLKKHFLSAFGKLGKEILAKAIVYFCQKKGHWAPFCRIDSDFLATCQEVGANPAFLDKLVEDGYLIIDRYKKYCVTVEFVKRCHEVAPN